MKNMVESERSPLGLAWTDRDGEVHLLQRLGTRLQQHRQDNCQPNKIPAPLLHSFTSPSLSHFLLVFLLFCILRFELSTVPQFWHTNLHTLLNADFAQEMAVLVMLTAYCLSDQAQWSLYVPRSGNYMYRKVVIICTASLTLKNSFSPHSVFMCFVWISEQTAIISLYNINWLVFITEMERVYCAVRTGFVVTVVTIRTTSLTFTNSTHSVFMCFVWISEQTAIISLCNINWLVFITETEFVYCAVQTGSVVTMVTICTTSLTFTILRSAHTVYLCFLCVSQNKQRLFPYTTLTDWFL